MLLNDIGKSPTSTLKSINQHLDANYGFKISEEASDKDLVMIIEQIEEEITELKMKGDDAKKSPEISKRLLVLEGVRQLREFAMLKLQNPKYNSVIEGLSDFVVELFNITASEGSEAASFENAVNKAMDEYRSSKYRFPDDVVEQKVRNLATVKLQGTSTPDSGLEMGIGEDVWARETDRSGGSGGYVPDLEFDNFDTDGLSFDDSEPENNEIVPMVRDRSGQMVPDPFAAQAAARRKGITMHEHELSGAKLTEGRKILPAPERTWSRPLEYSDQLKRDRRGNQYWLGDHIASTLGISDPFGKIYFDNISMVDDNTSKTIMHDALSGNYTFDDLVNAAREFYSGNNVQEGSIIKIKGIKMKEQKNLVKNLRRLLETEVSQAEVMMAAKNFAEELQEMIEKIGRLQNEDLPPVTDQMRETYGTDSSSAFQTQIYGALQGVMDSLYTAKGQVDDSVSTLAATGQFNASVDMEKDFDADLDADADIAMDADLDATGDLDNIEAELDAEVDDGFGGAEEEEPLGRSLKKESVDTLKYKVLEMKRLVEKARKLREAQAEEEDDELDEMTKVFHQGERVPKNHPDAATKRPAAAAAARDARAAGGLRRGGDHEQHGSVTVARNLRK